MGALTVPTISDDLDLLRAALLYANPDGEHGFYVGPLQMGPVGSDGKRSNAKNPGVILGKTWQSRTSRDKDQICAWFIGTSANGLFIHAGRSGCVIVDVDHPELVPEVLARALWRNWDDPVEDRIARVPFQSTRPNEPGRGHYLFLQPLDRVLGNGHGTLGNKWGEIRGNNGIIVVEPTEHEQPSIGLYRWEQIGEVPPLPDDVDSCLASATADDEVDSASDERVKAFLEKCTGTDNENLAKGPLRGFTKEVEEGASRHDTCVKFACQLMREALMGYYPARSAASALYDLFEARLNGTPGRWPGPEYKSILAWAIGQAETIDVAARRAEMDARLAERDERLAREREAKRNPPPPGVDPKTGEVLDPDPFGLLKPDPDKYFQDKSIGCDVQLLAQDVLAMGPLALGRDGHFWEYKDGVWRASRNVVKYRVVHLLGPRYRMSHTGNVADVISATAPEIRCDPVSDYWNCADGMVNWRTGQKEPHSPDFYSTVQFPWSWDDTATCPKFDKFLEEALTPDYVELCWQMIGYSLYSGNPWQRAFMLMGKGGEGKGTLLRVLVRMLGEENIATESLTSLNTSKFSAINLFGKIANIAGDIEATFQTETNIFKAITGEDYLGAEHKYGARFNFSNWAVPIFSANKIPGSADVTEGYLRRWLVIRFAHKPDRVIPGFSEQLLPEIPGIAVKAMKYLRQVMDSGFKQDGDVSSGLDEFAKAVDQVRLWVEECCEEQRLTVVGQPHRVPRSDLYRSYCAWASENNCGKLKAHEFYERLKTAGHREVKINGVRFFEGLRVAVLAMQGTIYDKDSPQPVDKWSTSS